MVDRGAPGSTSIGEGWEQVRVMSGTAPWACTAAAPAHVLSTYTTSIMIAPRADLRRDIMTSSE